MDATDEAAGREVRSHDNEGKKDAMPSVAARNAMLLLATVVFIGWLMMWVVWPTRTYSLTWSPKLTADTNSTYFGTQGTKILIYVFPILFISVVASVYLHLQEGSDIDTQSQRGVFSSRMAAWRRPVLVRGPLGIVTGIELAFFLMFLALLVWCYYLFLSVGFSNIQLDPAEKLWLAKLEVAASRLGPVGSICLAFLFFPVSRGSSLLPFVGLTSEASVKYHVWLGNIVVAIFTVHGLCFVTFWASTNQIDEMVRWPRTDVANIAGELALLTVLTMWATARPTVRRRMFELFYYTHHLYIVLLVLYVLHVGATFFCYILPGVYLFMVDRYLRFLQSRTRVRLVSARLLPSEALELNFSKSHCLTYKPMSKIFINVPCVSRLQWHPFTVTSSSSLEPERLSVVIKREGAWTQKLYAALSSLPPSAGRLEVSVEGPYSAATSTRFLGYDSLVMVSGGSGITPFISIIRELIYRSYTAGAATPRLLLVCMFKTSADLAMLDLLVPASGAFPDISGLDLRIEAYVTREIEAHSDISPAQQVWFKPSPSDAPISPVLGPNSWLWLAAIVSSSFVIFLVLIGVLQRFYIYPVDRNTNKVYPWAARTTLNLLFLCVIIAAAASAAFLWNKRRSDKEAKQIKNVDVPTPGMSPASWPGEPGGGDRELESLPQQFLAQVTKVHFGNRPDLKRMLLEIVGENVGMMASGPPGLLEDVATICSSGSTSNLHFESISFSW